MFAATAMAMAMAMLLRPDGVLLSIAVTVAIDGTGGDREGRFVGSGQHSCAVLSLCCR